MSQLALLPLDEPEAEHRPEDLSSAALASSDSLQPVNDFPAFDEIRHGDLLALALSTNTTRLTHGLHRFPAKYIPQIPRWAMRQFTTQASVVLDPFMGSGTTLVEGLCSVNQTFGTDIDPLARLISAAKTAKYNAQRLARLTAVLLEARKGPKGAFVLPMSEVKNVGHWFNDEAWQTLSSIFAAIERLDCSETERNYFFCIFSSILRWVSNADDQTQKTYVSGTLKKNPPPVWETFEKALIKSLNAVKSLDDQRGPGAASLLDGSALSIPLPDGAVDLVVTSPPYLDSVDYMYNFMLEYFWLGPKIGVPSRSDFNARRRTPVGAKNPLSRDRTLPRELLDLVNLNEVPGYRKEAILNYFGAMKAHFEEAARVMKTDGRYVLVIGNSQAQSGVIAVHDCLLRLARSAGLHLEKAFAYRIRRHYMKFPRKGRGGIILMDWVITLRKTDRAILPVEDRLPLPNITIGHDEVAH
ncbi:hypothetical protein [Paraburkholderia sp. GAS38]|uniref:hypothetical protein n=1 Tax=Paraburkholderia sp. GAS38 TaxID=3035133 RepID=UPI003D249E86